VNIHRIYAAISPHFRRRRMRWFVAKIAPTADTTILDVGGYSDTWDYIAGLDGRITILNVPSQSMRPSTERYQIVSGDGTALTYADQSFDVVFSNSVIEHVGDFEKQKAFASEASRVGRALWIQTPARSFPLEPHLIAPFIHWFPAHVQKRLARRCTLWGLMSKPTPSEVDEFLDSIRLLDYAEMRMLFPDCEILVERFLGIAKSYTAYRRAPAV
jgi:hypothetical protein